MIVTLVDEFPRCQDAVRTGRFSTMTGWFHFLDSFSAKSRADTSTAVPAGEAR